MAKTTVTVAVLIFLFAVAQARFLSDLTADRTLLLPTEKPKTETQAESFSTAVVAWEPEISEPKHAISDSETDLKSMTVISVRPIKRGGSHKLPFPDFHRSKHVHGGKVTGYRRGKVSSGERKRTGSGLGSRKRQFPGRLMRLRNPGLKRVEMKKRHRNNRYHVGKVEARRHVPKHVHEDERAGGFVKNIRKFLMSF